jgi:hypothetical protein
VSGKTQLGKAILADYHKASDLIVDALKDAAEKTRIGRKVKNAYFILKIERAMHSCLLASRSAT